MSNRIHRNTMDAQEIQSGYRTIRAKGIDSVLLVTGEHKSKVGIDYFRFYVPLVRQVFSSLMLEVQLLSQAEYAELKGLRLDGVRVYSRNLSPPTYRCHLLRR